MLLGRTLHLTEEGWRVMTWLWLFYFIFVSGLNEYVRLNFEFSEWAFFKVAILVPLTLFYALLQIGLLKRYKPQEDAPNSSSSTSAQTTSTSSKSQPRADSDALREPVL